MRALRVYLCGPIDVQGDMARVRDAISVINGSISYQIGVTLDVCYWKIGEGGLDAQNRIFNEIIDADIVIFLFYRRLGSLTPKEFDIALRSYQDSARPEIKVWFKYVPSVLDEDTGVEYSRLKEFKTHLTSLGQYGLMYHTYQSDEPIAVPFSDNRKCLMLELLVHQELLPFLLKSTGLNQKVIEDGAHLPVKEGITREMVMDHWRRRAHRLGLAAVMSTRYPEEQLQQASDELVSFVIKRTKHYLSGKSVIELGSGIGRFTLPLSQLSKNLTAVDMSPEMKERAKSYVGEAWDRIDYIESFVEDLPETGHIYDCAFSCLLFIHILNEKNLRTAVEKIKAIANTVIICEHMDEDLQHKVSNFTRIWPRSKYEEFFGGSFEEISTYRYNYLGDNLELVIFRRKMLSEELNLRTLEVLKEVPKIGVLRIPEEWRVWYYPFQFNDLVIPYEHLMGSNFPDSYEFLRIQVDTIQSSDIRFDLPDDIINIENQLTQNVVEKILLKRDYIPKDEVKARIDKIEVGEINPIDAIPRRLTIHLRPVRYFHYLMVKEALSENLGQFRKKHTAYKAPSLKKIESLSTTNIGGCGIFLLTRDNYIILCRREKVAEYSGTVSYSASASISWSYPGSTNMEANPFLTIVRETYEELGVPLNEKELYLFAVGLDLTAFFVQFSFYCHINMLASEVISLWQGATAKYEQVPFAVQLTPQGLSQIVYSYSLEPAAAATLIQLACKMFGQKTIEKCMRDGMDNIQG